MEQHLEHIQNLTKAIFDNSYNVASYIVKNVGLKYTIKIFNNNNKIVFSMSGNYNNVVSVCRLILEKQIKDKGGIYVQQC